MKTIKKLQYMMLATIVAMANHEIRSSVEGTAPKSTAQTIPTQKGSLTQTQKAQQAALPFGKRMLSKTGEGLGFESRGNLVQGKGKAKMDASAQERSFNTKDEIGQAIRFDTSNKSIDLNDNSNQTLSENNTINRS
jgi:hypothetical protein